MSDVGIALGTSRARWVLAATALGSGMAFLDGTVVNVALPAMGEDFNAGMAGLQWIVNGYMLMLAALILLSGSLGDRLGRRRVFVIGVIWFAVASMLCAAAPTLEVMIAGRVLQGIGGALLTPGSLAILQTSFQRSDRA
jgi:MFS family permease